MENIVRKKSVGSFTMGIMLIIIGIYMLISIIWKNFNAESIVYICPFMLISLGTEVLLYLNKNRDNNVMVKYDVFSILFISFVSFCTVCGYILIEYGLNQRLFDGIIL